MHGQNKYGSIRQTYNGYPYDSKLEARAAMELDLRIKAKDIKSYERQKTIRLMAYGKPICNYRIDFVLTHNDGTLEYLEIKGFSTDLWKLKWKLFEAQLAETEPTAKATIQYG